MIRADFINKFKNDINVGGQNYIAHADAALVEVFINSHIVNNMLIMKCFIFGMQCETLSMRRINTGVHRVCKIEFTLKFTLEILRNLKRDNGDIVKIHG